MTRHHLPAGCHDAESAAQVLGMSKRALLQKLRELGWLNVGGGQSNHNMPRRELVKCGFLFTQERGYCLKGKREIAKSYSVMLLTQAGFNALKHELAKEKMPIALPKISTEIIEAAPAKMPPAPEIQQDPEEKVIPFNREVADAEREKALAQLREWGLAS